MTPEEIAKAILNSLREEARKSWRYEFGPATRLVEILFWPTTSVSFLDIGAVTGCFESQLTKVSWQKGGDEPDSPRIVIEGSKGGKLVQAVFVLRDTEPAPAR